MRSRSSVYRVRPALACIIGARLAWTVEMISSVSIPCKYISAGRREVRVAELALDQRQRDPLVQQLDGVRMAELMRREPPPDPGLDGRAMQLEPRGTRRPPVPTGGADDHAEQRSDR